MSINEFDIAKLRLCEGDVLVVRTVGLVTAETAHAIRDHLSSLLPKGVKSLIIDRDIELSVLTREEIERRAAA